MKKRVIALFLVGVLLILPACSLLPIDEYTIYKNAYDKTQALTSANLDLTMSMEMDISGESINLNSTGNCKQKEENGKTLFLVDLNNTVLGTTQKLTQFSDGQKAYVIMDIPGLGKKTIDLQLDIAKLQDLDNQFDTASFAEDMVKSISSVNENGGKRLKVTLDGAKFGDNLNSIITNNLEGLIFNSEKIEMLTFTCSDVEVELFVDKDGYISEQRMKYKFDVTVPKEASMTGKEATVSIDSDITVKMIDPGKAVDFTLPDATGAITMADLTDMLTQP